MRNTQEEIPNSTGVMILFHIYVICYRDSFVNFYPLYYHLRIVARATHPMANRQFVDFLPYSTPPFVNSTPS